MSDRDTVNVARALGDLSNFYTVPQRVMQGMINQLVMTRALTGACGDLPELQVDGVGPAIADGAPYFLGISQGGIYGGTLLALSTEFERGALLVGAMNYPIMTGRSLDFETYEIILKAFYYDRIDRELLMNLASSMWDYAEPGPWLAHLTKDPVEGTAAKKLLYQTALNDCQVPNLASDMGARTIGLPLLNEPLEQLYGLETADGPTDSAYVVYDTGVPTIPPGNIAPSDDSGSHSTQRYVEAARQQINAFFQPDGQIQSFCEGPCNPN